MPRILIFLFFLVSHTLAYSVNMSMLNFSTTEGGNSSSHQKQSKAEDQDPQEIQVLSSLLNCDSFAQLLSNANKTQLELLSLHKKDGINLQPVKRSKIMTLINRRTRYWARKLLKNMRKVFRSCLSSPLQRLHLQKQLSSALISDTDLTYDHNQTSLTGTTTNVMDDKEKQDLSSSSHRTPGQHSNGVDRMSSKVSVIRKNRSKIAYLSNVILKMMSTKGKIDFIELLQTMISTSGALFQQLPQILEASTEPQLKVRVHRQIRKVPPYFLSVALGARVIQHGTLEKLTGSRHFLTLASGLSPAILRYGGSYANFVLFDHNENFDSTPLVLHKYPKEDESEEKLVFIDRISDSQLNVEDVPQGDEGLSVLLKETGNVLDTLETANSAKDDSHQFGTLKQNDSLLHDEDDLARIPIEYRDGCPFDSEWHSFYTRSKPSSDSTYNLLSALLPNSEIEGNNAMQDDPRGFESESCCDFNETGYSNFTMTASDWSNLVNLTDSIRMKLLFDINQFYRTNAKREWDPTNARTIFQNAFQRGDSVLWQLGNEPNSYKKYGLEFTGHNGAKDFNLLYQELLNFFVDPAIVGPDVTRPHHHPITEVESEVEVEIEKDFSVDATVFLEDFLSNLNINLSAVTWHQYYVNGREATVDDFISPEVLDNLSWQIPQIIRLRDELSPGTPIWLTETSSAWGGGAKDLSNRYADGFLWLDKLGMSAASGIDMVARQTLYDGHYALIDGDLNPNPSYWLSYVYKLLVGEKVLTLSLEGSSSTTRLYAHCQKPHSHSYEPGNIVIFGMNVANVSVTIKVDGIQPFYFILQYLLQPGEDNLQSGVMLLNGEKMHLTSEEELPDVFPVVLPHRNFQIPPTSFGFWVIANAQILDCFD